MTTATTFQGKRGLHGVANIGAVLVFSGDRGLHGVANVEAAPTFEGKRGLHGVANIVDERSPMDSLILFPPGASSLPTSVSSAIQLGSWLMADPGADYGAKGLIRSIESGNALVDGGLFGNRYAPVRKMAIPLILNSAAPATSPALWEAAIVRAAMPGAMIAIVPEATATRQEVFFDVIDGRWEPDYNTFHNRVGVRKGTLYLDTQPYGYWPTEILLASSASVGGFGQMPVNGASVIGDGPLMAHLLIQPTTASFYVGADFKIDMAAFGLGGRPSFQPLIGASSFVVNAPNGVSTAFDKYAPASTILTVTVGSGAGWFRVGDTGTFIGSALEPAYRGRFRVFAFARAEPSSGLPWQMLVDAERWNSGFYAAMASANQVASVYNSFLLSGGMPTVALMASPMYGIHDLGEITLPPQASGFQQGVRLRVWAAALGTGAATVQTLNFGGLFLLPVDGAAGILPRGLAIPTMGGGHSPSGGTLELNNGFVDSVVVNHAVGSQVAMDARANYRGVSPNVGATTNSLTMLLGYRYAELAGQGNSPTYPVFDAGTSFAAVSVSYRPSFQFMYGV